jgi:aspartyl/asparaginyl beta-hydroxylase (cupin superfamily)
MLAGPFPLATAAGLLLQAAAAAAFSSPSLRLHTGAQAPFTSGQMPLRKAPVLHGQALCRPRRHAAGLSVLSAQIKFADAVEELLVRKWDKKKVARVVESWRRMDEDYIHKEFKSEHETWQECNSFVEGLPCKTFHDPYAFEWAQKLRENAKTIQDEFNRVAIEGSDELDAKGNNVWATAANSTSAQSYGPDWKTLALMDRCVWDPINVHLFPETTKLLRDIDVPCLEAFFARMQPNSKIAPHSDYCNFALTAHLGLVIPENQCWIKVGKDTREWRNGEMLMFDTSLLHEAANTADTTRYILMFRVWHPDLGKEEVEAIKYIFACLDEPDIVEGTLHPRDPQPPNPNSLYPKPPSTPSPESVTPTPTALIARVHCALYLYPILYTLHPVPQPQPLNPEKEQPRQHSIPLQATCEPKL